MFSRFDSPALTATFDCANEPHWQQGIGTAMSYFPGGNAILYPPRAELVARISAPVAEFFACTMASFTTPPSGSVIEPAIDAVWPKAQHANEKTMANFT